MTLQKEERRNWRKGENKNGIEEEIKEEKRTRGKLGGGERKISFHFQKKVKCFWGSFKSSFCQKIQVQFGDLHLTRLHMLHFPSKLFLWLAESVLG